MKKLRVAFVGFRHGHIFSLYEYARRCDILDVVAVCEEDAETRSLLASRGVVITHNNYEEMLREVPCEVIACGDYYGIRGKRLIKALEKDKHVIADKPLCTSLEELEQIAELSRKKNLKVGCMLDLPTSPVFHVCRQVIKEGRIGEVHTVVFLGQHPLRYGSRPKWYFEVGKHGGTINDIAIHAIDMIPWLTERRFVEITAARVWNARCTAHPYFQDGACVMLRLDNDGCVFGDVSYLSPENKGYQMPNYWRFTISGTEGVLETSCTSNKVFLWTHTDEGVFCVDMLRKVSPSPLEDFISEIQGSPNYDGLHTQRIIRSSFVTLLTQKAADTCSFSLTIPDEK